MQDSCQGMIQATLRLYFMKHHTIDKCKRCVSRGLLCTVSNRERRLRNYNTQNLFLRIGGRVDEDKKFYTKKVVQDHNVHLAAEQFPAQLCGCRSHDDIYSFTLNMTCSSTILPICSHITLFKILAFIAFFVSSSSNLIAQSACPNPKPFRHLRWNDPSYWKISGKLMANGTEYSRLVQRHMSLLLKTI